MTDKHKHIIAMMDEYYKDHRSDAIDLALLTTRAFYLGDTVPTWVFCASQMIVEIYDDGTTTQAQ